MHILLKALDIGPGDEVITPSITWVSTVNLIVLAGATPVFADIDRDTLMTSAEHIAPLITDKTKLIIPVHFAGAAVDMEPIRQLAASHSITLVEDAAHAAGTEYKGRKIGNQGSTIFSFHPIKNMTTGEGGMAFGFFLLTMRFLMGAAWAAEGVFTLFAILFVFIGAQFIGLGLLGEYIGRIYQDVRGRPRYFVQKVVIESSDQKS